MADRGNTPLDATLVLATVTGIGYFAGARFMAGYFKYFGVNPDYLGFPVPAYLETGMFHTGTFFAFWLLAWAASKSKWKWVGYLPPVALVVYGIVLTQRAESLGVSPGNLRFATGVAFVVLVACLFNGRSLGAWFAEAVQGRVLTAVALLAATALPFGYGAEVWGRERAMDRLAAKSYRDVQVLGSPDLPKVPMLLIANAGGHAYLVERNAKVDGVPVVWIVPDHEISALRVAPNLD